MAEANTTKMISHHENCGTKNYTGCMILRRVKPTSKEVEHFKFRHPADRVENAQFFSSHYSEVTSTKGEPGSLLKKYQKCMGGKTKLGRETKIPIIVLLGGHNSIDARIVFRNSLYRFEDSGKSRRFESLFYCTSQEKLDVAVEMIKRQCEFSFVMGFYLGKLLFKNSKQLDEIENRDQENFLHFTKLEEKITEMGPDNSREDFIYRGVEMRQTRVTDYYQPIM